MDPITEPHSPRAVGVSYVMVAKTEVLTRRFHQPVKNVATMRLPTPLLMGVVPAVSRAVSQAARQSSRRRA